MMFRCRLVFSHKDPRINFPVKYFYHVRNIVHLLSTTDLVIHIQNQLKIIHETLRSPHNRIMRIVMPLC